MIEAEGASLPARQCVVLVGGRGTRLGSLTQDCPKPLLRVAGVPFLEYLVRNVGRHGIRRFLFLAGYRADMVEAAFGPSCDLAHEMSAEFEVVHELKLLGTGGALRNAAARLESDFLLLNGDSFFDINILALTLDRDDVLGRLALRRVEEAARYGVVEVDGDRITDFKARPDRPGPSWVNAGIYRLKREIIDCIPVGASSLEGDVLPKLAKAGRLDALLCDRFFIDIGVTKDLAAADRLMPAVLRRTALFMELDQVQEKTPSGGLDSGPIRIEPGIRRAIRRCNDEGVLVLVLAPDSAIESDERSERLRVRLNEVLARFGTHIDDVIHMTSEPSDLAQPLRGPSKVSARTVSSAFEAALSAWSIDVERSLVVSALAPVLSAASRLRLQTIRMWGDAVDDWLAKLARESRS